MHVAAMVRRAARLWSDRPALRYEDRTVSFRQFDEATDRLGTALLQRGLAPGDRVGVLLPNGIDGLVAYYALAKAGLVRVPLNVRERLEDHRYKMSDSGCRALLSLDPAGLDAEVVLDAEELARASWSGRVVPCDVPRHAEAPYRLGYTGGTTGPPKAVTLTMRGEHAEVANFLLDLLPGLGPDDVMLHAAPVIHASGAFFLPHLLRGSCNVVLPRFEASAFLEAVERHRPTVTFLVPTMISLVLDDPGVHDADLSSLRRVCYGASPIAPALADRAIARFGPVLAQTYGQAEAPMTITVLRPEEHHRVGSAGRAYTLAEVAVVDEDGREVAPGAEGEIVTRGQHLMSGYWNRPAETAVAVRDGWLHTGDIGTMDGDGYVYLLDRRNDVIISGGSNVYPREVEDVLLGHPAVTEAAVVGLPDDRWGEVVHAVVATRSPVEPAELLAFVTDRVAGYKRPRRLDVWAELPKSPAGKILRRTVRDAVRDAPTLTGTSP